MRMRKVQQVLTAETSSAMTAPPGAMPNSVRSSSSGAGATFSLMTNSRYIGPSSTARTVCSGSGDVSVTLKLQEGKTGFHRQ